MRPTNSLFYPSYFLSANVRKSHSLSGINSTKFGWNCYFGVQVWRKCAFLTLQNTIFVRKNQMTIPFRFFATPWLYFNKIHIVLPVWDQRISYRYMCRKCLSFQNRKTYVHILLFCLPGRWFCFVVCRSNSYIQEDMHHQHTRSQPISGCARHPMELSIVLTVSWTSVRLLHTSRNFHLNCIQFATETGLFVHFLDILIHPNIIY